MDSRSISRQGDKLRLRRLLLETREAQARWAGKTVGERLGVVRRFRQWLAGRAERIAGELGKQGKRQAREILSSEVLPVLDACRHLERRAGVVLRPARAGWRGRPFWLAGVDLELRRDPLGVVLVIGPGNYPLFIPGVQVLQALVAGNGVLAKPGRGGWGAAQVLWEGLVFAGMDPALMRALPEDPGIVRPLIEAGVDKILFTGSSAVGKIVLKDAAEAGVPSVMELSGADPVLIRRDAKLETVVRALIFGLTFNRGRTCIAPRRVYVPEGLSTELEGRLAAGLGNASETSGAGSGGGDEELSDGGTDASEIFESVIRPALARGAHLVHGTERAGPWVIAGMGDETVLPNEAVFGPVLFLMGVKDDADALARIEKSPFQLGASIFTADQRKGRALARRIPAGVVTVNDLIVPTADPRIPFGGRKRSGFGMTRGDAGLLELTAVKAVSVRKRGLMAHLREAGENDERMLAGYARLVHGRGLKERWLGFRQMVAVMRGKAASAEQKKGRFE